MEKEIVSVRAASKNQLQFYDDRLKDMETKFDNKITVFMSAISIDCSDKIDKKTK